MNKLLIITGPTATGKTKLGVHLANKFSGEIISADSRQVYKHMDIGTGKDRKEYGKIPVWGLDLISPNEDFSASQFVNFAKAKIADIWAREKLPIVVGGTGLYIKELLEPSQTLHIKPDAKLRAKLLDCSVVELQNKLQEKDLNKWEKMNESDRQNPRRLIRAIEVAGKGDSGVVPPLAGLPRMTMEYLIIGLTAPFEDLYQRIDKRVEDRIAMGMEREREGLKKYKLPKTIGYFGESPQEWKFAEHGYSRRQLTYMKKYLKNVIWYDTTDSHFQNKIEGKVFQWYSEVCNAKTD